MMKFLKTAIPLSVSMLLTASVAYADEPKANDAAPLRPVTSSYTLSVGSAHQANTYLTPLTYDGMAIQLGYERWQAMKFDPGRWVMRLEFDVDLDRTDNPARNATMWYGGVRAQWSMMRRWGLNSKLTIGAGPATSLDLGCLYNQRNGNNPAAAKAAWMVGVQAYGTYTLQLGSLPVTLGYHALIPITGAFFSPQYGELYYEIYLGDHSGLAHWGWWGNYFTLNQQLTADLHFGATALRLGFAMDYETTSVNHIVSRTNRYMATVGITGEWISLNPRHGYNIDRQILSAY